MSPCFYLQDVNAAGSGFADAQDAAVSMGTQQFPALHIEQAVAAFLCSAQYPGTAGIGDLPARFTGQVLTEAMSQGGDSGSLVVDGTENKAVGLLFAGSPVATVFTPIDAVLVALNVII